MDLSIIRKISEAKKIPMSGICKKLDISESGLQLSMNRNTIKASTLELIARELHEPITTFYYSSDYVTQLPKLSTFGERLEWVIRRRDMSGTSYAKHINTNKSTINRILKNQREPGFDVLGKIIADNRNIDKDWLLFGTVGILYEESENLVSEPAVKYKKSCKECARHIETNINLNKLIKKLECELLDCYAKLKNPKKGSIAS